LRSPVVWLRAAAALGRDDVTLDGVEVREVVASA
jgi:hypothetical protein